MQAAVKAVSAGKGHARRQAGAARAPAARRRAGENVETLGEFVTLREVVDEVGKDAVRFDMLYRKNDAVLDFDLAKVIEATPRKSCVLRSVRSRAR